MLLQLKQLHAAILSNLDELETLTAMPQPPMDRLPAVRLLLTRASRSRTMLLEGTYGELIARAPPERKVALEALRAEGKDGLVRSGGHIGTWTIREVTCRWSDYCAASNVMQAAMRIRIRKEAALVYPLLADLPTSVHVN